VAHTTFLRMANVAMFEQQACDVRGLTPSDASILEEKTATQSPRSQPICCRESSAETRCDSKCGDSEDEDDDASCQEGQDDEYYAFLREM
ncbi:unnamed protein product, partial [Polarella glacialis]